MQQLNNIEYLLLDYVSTRYMVRLSYFCSTKKSKIPPTFVVHYNPPISFTHYNKTQIAHNLNNHELAAMVYKLIKQELLYPYSRNNNNYLNRTLVYLTEKRIYNYFSIKEKDIVNVPNQIEIYIKLSDKGAKVWEEKIQPNWDKFYLATPLDTKSWENQYAPDSYPLTEKDYTTTQYTLIQATNLEHAERIENYYKRHAPIAKHLPIDRKVLPTWYIHDIYWKEFPHCYLHSIPLHIPADKKIWTPDPNCEEWQEINKWRREWFRNEQGELLLTD